MHFETSDKAFKLQLGGRIMNDTAFGSADTGVETALGDLEDGTEFRRARLYMAGVLYERLEFKAQYDFAGGDADFKDVYLGLRKLPGIGGLRIGHFKEPFGLEELTSSKYITFMERSLVTVFVPSRNTGMMIHNHALDQRLTWAFGVFRDTGTVGDGTAEGKFNVTARLTGLLFHEDKGRRLVHLGAAYSRRNPNGDSVDFDERPEAHLFQDFVDTGSVSADTVDLLGVEAAWVYGPVSVQAEFMRADVDAISGTDPTFSGFYIYGSYFLTGESRRYKPAAGAFSRVKPSRYFLAKQGGPGAWEIAARYSHLDLSDAGIGGGELNDFTLGLNWYLNPNSRFMWNFVRADLDSVGDSDIFEMRFQVDF